MLDRQRDYSTQEGAQALVDHINRYWATRGRRTRAEAVRTADGSYIVKSNIRGAKP